MTSVKKAPLMAFLLGLGLMLSMLTLNSFKAEKRTDYYWYYNTPSTGVYVAKGLSSTPPGSVSCPSVVNQPQNCLKGFITDPGAANAATTTAQQNINRQFVP